MSASPQTVFVVVGGVGEYSDRREWTVAVLHGFSLEDAQRWVDAASAQSRRLWDERRQLLDVDMFDPVVDQLDAATLWSDRPAGRSEGWRTELDWRCNPTYIEPTVYRLDQALWVEAPVPAS